eukprot:jgi/Galph1/1525/GphlegSOOS_G205.1
MLEQSVPNIGASDNDESGQESPETVKFGFSSSRGPSEMRRAEGHRRNFTWGRAGDQVSEETSQNCLKTGVWFYLKQTEALMVKSFHFQKRQRVELCLNVLAPLIILAVLYGISHLAHSIAHDAEVKYEAKDEGYLFLSFEIRITLGTFRFPLYLFNHN